ncbi:MAG: Kdo2-lipid lauroyltransferase/acyltransferase [Humisphaera sp.]|nr:Kdo2-lipid lauroyltransferase/acyltransferase [Humisphaera sp.]
MPASAPMSRQPTCDVRRGEFPYNPPARRAARARMAKKQRNDFLDRLVYLALRVVNMAAHSWGIRVASELAKFAGAMMFAIDKKHRDRAMGNLRRSFPDAPERQLRRLARRSMQALCLLAIEVLFTTRLIRIDTFRRYIVFGDRFREALALMLKREQGMIMLTGHYGNWEILGYVLATLGFPTVSVARPLDNPYVSEFVFGVRERTGQRIIAKKGATQEIVDVLEKHGVVGFIADQNAGPKGMFVDFFGRKASTYKSIALLAMQYEVPVVIGYARRIHDDFRFEVGCQDIIYPSEWKDERDPLRYITQRYTKGIEDFVRKDPGQYLWVHRRWKTRPKGEEPETFD